MPHQNNNAIKLLSEASDCGLRITNLDGWTQTRLAEALHIRRETLNAIINQSPGAEPTPQRPRMLEACQRIIAFAAALSAKEDAVLKLPIDAANLQSDDGQAYEHHRLRLHGLVEQAALDNHYTDALCRLGEFASSALHAPPQFRLRMLCNLVTAIQRLLDKPGSRDVAAPVLQNNLRRLYRALRCARRFARPRLPDDASTREQFDYIHGQAGYALIYCGMLLGDPRLVHRGGRRLFPAVAAQPDPSYGHWSNLLRATSDLIASAPADGRQWAVRLLPLAESQPAGAGFAQAYLALEAKNEISHLRAHWDQNPADARTLREIIDRQRRTVSPRTASTDGNGRAALRRRATASAIGILFALTALYATPARAGDGRDFKSANTAAPQTAPPPAARPAVRTAGSTGAASTAAAGGATGLTVVRPAGLPTTPPNIGYQKRPSRYANGLDLRDLRNLETPGYDADDEPLVIDPPPPMPPVDDTPLVARNTDPMSGPASVGQLAHAAWGDSINSYARSAPARRPVAAPAPSDKPAPVPKPVPPTDPAARAARDLEMARNYLASDRTDIARAKLISLVQNYPETPSAKDARALLDQLPH
jgi:hypothetical protein